MSSGQNYSSHARYVPAYHFFLAALLLLTIIGSVINLVQTIRHGGDGLYSASLIVALSVGLFMAGLYARVFALKVQDRVIFNEENARHLARTGKPLNDQLTHRQVIALRFASDEEYDDLAARAIAENLSEKAIKQAVKNWRGDYRRA